MPAPIMDLDSYDPLERYLDAFFEAGLDPKVIQTLDMVNEVGRGIGAPPLSNEEAEEIFALAHSEEIGPDGSGGVRSTDIDYQELYRHQPTHEGEGSMSDTQSARNLIDSVMAGQDPEDALKEQFYGTQEGYNGMPGGTGGSADVEDPGTKRTDYTQGDMGAGAPAPAPPSTSPDPDDGHTHSVSVDAMGHGSTGSAGMNPHMHNIVKWQVTAYKVGEYVSQHFGLLNRPQS